MSFRRKEIYTIESLAKKTGYSKEYLRQACRGYMNRNGSLARLPDGYEGYKAGNRWLMRRIK